MNSEQKKNKAIEMWKMGRNETQIAKHLHLTERTVYRYVQHIRREHHTPRWKPWVLDYMRENFATVTREDVAEWSGLSHHTIKKYESRLRQEPDSPQSLAMICPGCEKKFPWFERHKTKTNVTAWCPSCWKRCHPNSDPERLKHRNRKQGVTDPLPGDTIVASSRIPMAHPIWKNGYCGCLSPGWAGLPSEPV